MTALNELASLVREGLPEKTNRDELGKRCRDALEGIFGERYQARAPHGIRVVLMPSDDNVSFAGFVHPDSPSSGAYGGTSLIWFPISSDGESGPASLLTLVCGTRGLSPDEQILGRPGHARNLRALRRYLSKQGVSVWSKYDPTNLSQPLPETVRRQYPGFASVFSRYGSFIYCAAPVPRDPEKAERVVAAFLDLYAWERGWSPLKAASNEVEAYLGALRANLFERVDRHSLVDLLYERQFVILEGPPGTGKTRMAREVLEQDFAGHGMTVQFHPAVTYETFVAGISPDVSNSNLRFGVSPGWLIQAVRQASSKFLLHIDEINRADLGRVLGEAIYLFECGEIRKGEGRRVTLPQSLDDGTRELTIPENLYILGTMNSADRSIAILDLAVRRRFAFIALWPDIKVVAEQNLPLATEAFAQLQDLFTQYAPEEALVLMPGHSYFLATSEEELLNRFRYELLPLLNEYLQEGRLGSCESEVHAYVDWLEGQIAQRAARN
ncbi:MAG: AAA family ATPase [Chloroflexi bacterium]|nr:AAA family ATPase [Chloroflexota bacterium]MCL5952724.1 AAA family ATPase [Chloroflexota bacterium]